VDHGGEVVWVGVAVSASVDQSDFGVDSFEAAIGEPVFDSGDDPVEVFPDPFSELFERGQVGSDC
jgi:hypothetical protein